MEQDIIERKFREMYKKMDNKFYTENFKSGYLEALQDCFEELFSAPFKLSQ